MTRNTTQIHLPTWRIRFDVCCPSFTFSTPGELLGAQVGRDHLHVLGVARCHLERGGQRVRGQVGGQLRVLLLHPLQRLGLRDELVLLDPVVVRRGSAPTALTCFGGDAVDEEDLHLELRLDVVRPGDDPVPSAIESPSRNMPISTVIVAAIDVERFAPIERTASEKTSLNRVIRSRTPHAARRASACRGRARSRACASCRPSRGRG